MQNAMKEKEKEKDGKGERNRRDEEDDKKGGIRRKNLVIEIEKERKKN